MAYFTGTLPSIAANQVEHVGQPRYGTTVLYISKQLVEAMEGDIWVESTGIAGQGSRFSFTLPLATLDTAEQEYPTPDALADLLPLTSMRMAPREEQSDAALPKTLE